MFTLLCKFLNASACPIGGARGCVFYGCMSVCVYCISMCEWSHSLDGLPSTYALNIIFHSPCAFSALTLLVGRQEGHPAYENWVVECWRGYLSGARCRLAYGPADATATHCLVHASVKSRLVVPFWYWLTWVVPDKGMLSSCCCFHPPLIILTMTMFMVLLSWPMIARVHAVNVMNVD